MYQSGNQSGINTENLVEAFNLKTDLTMGKYFPLLLIICFLFIEPSCHAQTSVSVSDPRIELQGSTIHIYYDFLNTDASDKFDVSIDITDEKGKKIKAKALEGDIGDGIESGNNRHITWDLDLDKIFMNAQIFFEINATLVPKPEPPVTQAAVTQAQEAESQPPEANIQEADTQDPGMQTANTQEPVTQETIEEDSPAEEASRKESTAEDLSGRESPPPDLSGSEPSATMVSGEFNRTGLILQSLAVPGLGLSRLKGKPHWIRGVAGYGCIGGSFLLNQQARKTFNSVEESPGFEDKQELYKTSIRQDNISEVLAYTAIGIWMTDIVWTILGTSDLDSKFSARNTRGVSFGSNLDPITYTPMVRIKYNF